MAERTTTRGKSTTGAKRGRPKGSTNKSNRTGSRNQSSSKMTKREKRINELILAISLFAVGIFLIISLQTAVAGAIGGGIRHFLMGCFGKAAYILPYYFIIYAVLLFIGKAGKTGKFYSSLFLASFFVLISMFYSIMCIKDVDSITYGMKWIGDIYTQGAAGDGGGVIGMNIALLLVKLFGSIGAYIITITLMAIVILVVANEPFAWLLGKHKVRQREKAIERERRRNEEWLREQEEREQYERDMELLRELTEANGGELPPDNNIGKKKKILDYMRSKEEAMFARRSEFEDIDLAAAPPMPERDGQLDPMENPETFDLNLENGMEPEGGAGSNELDSETIGALEEQEPEVHLGLPPEDEYIPQIILPEAEQTEADWQINDPSFENSAFQEIEEAFPIENAFFEGMSEDGEYMPPADAGAMEMGAAASAAFNAANLANSSNTANATASGCAGTTGNTGTTGNESNSNAGSDGAGSNSLEALQAEIKQAAELTKYEMPPLDLLNGSTNQSSGSEREDLLVKASLLEQTLQNFNVSAKVIKVSKGPAVTRYEIQPAVGVKVNSIVRLADDIALNLEAKSIRMEAPIPGKAAVGIEVENNKINAVMLKDVVDSSVFRESESKITFAVGEDISGNPVVANLKDMPHLLIAGSTGSGKSVCVNSIIISMLYKARPDEVKIILIDPKVVELSNYNGIPHLMIPVVNEPSKAAVALNWAVSEMNDRYRKFAAKSVKDLASYNRKMEAAGEEKLPQIVIIIDELADLMMAAPQQVEDAICRLAQMARAAGMHLIVATQRPSVDIITGVIKANIPSRIAFAVSSQIDSRTILDMAGAERLVGKGDMLFNPLGRAKPLRVQGTLVTDDEVERVIEFVKSQGHEQEFSNDLMHTIETAKMDFHEEEEVDELLKDAIEAVVNAEQASVSMLQRKFRIGYNRAARLVDMMEERGIVGPPDGSRPRRVLLSKQGLAELDGEIEAAQAANAGAAVGRNAPNVGTAAGANAGNAAGANGAPGANAQPGQQSAHSNAQQNGQTMNPHTGQQGLSQQNGASQMPQSANPPSVNTQTGSPQWVNQQMGQPNQHVIAQNSARPSHMGGYPMREAGDENADAYGEDGGNGHDESYPSHREMPEDAV